MHHWLQPLNHLEHQPRATAPGKPSCAQFDVQFPQFGFCHARWRFKPSGQTGARRPRAHPEDDLQAELVRWHARWVDQADAILFAVPNGEERRAAIAARLSGISAEARAELPEHVCLVPAGQGVLPGVSDLILLLPGGRVALLEVKIPKIVWPPEGEGLPLFSDVKRVVKHRAGSQSTVQKRFQAGAEALAHTYRIVRGVEGYKALLLELGVKLRPTPRLTF